MGLGGLEVKFGQIAPSLEDRKLHVLGWFLHRFGLAKTPIMAKFHKLTNFIKLGPGRKICFLRVGGSRGSALNAGISATALARTAFLIFLV